LTRLGRAALATGCALALSGLFARWAPVAFLGFALLLVVAAARVYVKRHPPVDLQRRLEPDRVCKGRPASVVIDAVNTSRRRVGTVVVVQRIGDLAVGCSLPALAPGERANLSYPLPTDRRGTFQAGPLEMPRSDPFGVCSSVPTFGTPQALSVRPRMVRLQPLPTGTSRYVEGPSSDTSPQGSVTFHRLRAYAPGDDLRTVHWPSTAKTGQLVVRHHVDTAQPYSIVVLDQSEWRYDESTFEEAVDVAASLAVSLSAGKAPLQLRTTSGFRYGGTAWKDPTPIVDHLTDVVPSREGSLAAELALVGKGRGASALVVVTGRLDPTDVASMASLRRRFDRLIAASLVAAPGRGPAHPALTIVEAADADGFARRWNRRVAR
jgi:uncharacterized protein (DUF58 family)